ncbi:Calx-beta domain-containing protein [Salibacter halophilus]|uniref:T9SS type A sorting domain-containing protein n=1 Tax=Salibacter halophilus TaxID=1803916 RepID=A0A6N6M648_9FLAO|nr:Calx-beta domain-containing protein [Salibacter halophilus]KAB1063732.1 T9SS type A sorting domain-containing protein [Salibacter halophilus]
MDNRTKNYASLFLTLSCLFLLSGVLKSQTPGGVATTTEVRFWYDVAEFSSASNNTSISTWTNKGGNSEDATQSSGSEQPTLKNNASNQVNGFPVIRFDGNNDALGIANNGDLNDGGPWDERTFNLVFKTGSNTSTQQVLYEEGGTTRGFSFIIEGGQLHINAWNMNNDGAASPWGLESENFNISSNQEYILSVVYDGGTSSSNGTIDCYLNSTQTKQLNSIGTLYNHTDNVEFGNSSSTLDQNSSSVNSAPFSGDILEFIVADYEVSTSERKIIENYLSSKYDINIGANDYYAYDGSGYYFDLIGIGQESGLSSQSAQGEGMISLSNPTGLGNSEYLLIANNSASTSSWSTSNSPDAANIEHLNEEWRVSEIGEVGDVDVTVDGTQLPGLTAGYKVGILVDDDGDFTSGAELYELSSSGSDYTGTVNLNNADYIRVAQFREVVSFNDQNQSSSESVNATPTVSINYVPTQNTTFTINYRTNDVSATSGSDYTAVPNGSSSVTINAGASDGSLPAVTVNNDAIDESDETFEVILESGSGYVLNADSVLTYTINDDDSPYKLYFDSDTSSVNESTSSISIPVKLSAQSSSAVSVDYSVVGGIATSGSDYNLSSGTLNFSAGDTVENISVSIVNNTSYEPDETVEIQLSNPSGADLDNGPSPSGTGFVEHELTIKDDDLPEVEFASSSATVSESDGSVSLTVNLSSAFSQNITVDYSINAGSASQGSDYTGSSGSVIILSGSSSSDIIIPIVNDCNIESSENFTVDITNVSIGTIGSTSSSTVTIQDDDVGGPGGVGCALKLWYRPDAGITGGGSVSSWTDDSQGVIASAAASNNEPQFNGGTSDTTFNFQNYLTFDGSNDRLGIDLSYNSVSLSKIYTFVAFRTNESGNSYNSNWAFLDFDRSEFFNTYITGDGKVALSYNSTDIEGSPGFNDNMPHIGGFVFDNSLSEDTKLFADGATEYSNDEKGGSFQVGANTTRYGYIGDGSEASSLNGSGNNIYYKGDIAEIIYVEGQTLSSVEINQIQTYLALKYGVTLNMTNDPATGSTDERDYLNSAGNAVWDYSANSGNNSAIAGLIRDDDASLEVLKARSVNGGAILTGEVSSLSDQESIVWGHNGQPVETEKNETGTLTTKLKREWKATEVGQTGNLTLKVDLSNLASIPSSSSDIYLLTDSDGDFSNATTLATATSINGSEVTFSNVDIDDGDYFTIGFYEAVIWTGSTWQNGSGSANRPAVADSTRKLFINGSGANIQSDAIVSYAEIASGADVTILTGNSLTVQNEIINDGTVTVNNFGSLVQTHSGANQNSGSGSYEVKKIGIGNPNYFNLWSSPIQSADILNTFNGANPCDVFVFDPATQLYSHDYTQGFSTTCNGNPVTFQSNQVISGGDGIMDVARGYYIPGKSGGTRTFTGDVNNGDYNISIQQNPNPSTPQANWMGDDWNLIGNPYPSSIDAAAFVNENSSAISGSIYFWDDAQSGNFDDGDFAVWNTMGGTSSPNSATNPNGSIGSGQGFWVVANSNGNVVFNNAMRNDQNGQFFKNDPQSDPKAWLTLEDSAGLTNQILVGFPQDATDGYDDAYDAYKEEGNAHIAFGSVLDTLGYAIQGLAPINPGSEKVVDLYLRSERSGERTIRLDSALAMDDHIIYLLDRKTGEEHDLSSGAFTFSEDYSIDDKSRFAIVFKRSQSTGIKMAYENKSVKIFTRENYIIARVETGVETIKKIKVYDLTGRAIIEQNTNENTVRINSSNLPTGVYVIGVDTGDSQAIKQKVVIH